MWVRILLPLQKTEGYASGLFNRRPNPLPNTGRPLNVKMGKFTNYIKESFVELTKKTTWPTWEKLQGSAILVMVTTVILAVVLWIIDLAFQSLMSGIYTL